MSSSENKEADTTASTKDDEAISNISMESITEGTNDRGIPATKFLDDIDMFANSFNPPASSELLIGAYSDLYSKFKAYEQQLEQKKGTYQEKLPEIEKSITLVQHLKTKKDAGKSALVLFYIMSSCFDYEVLVI